MTGHIWFKEGKYDYFFPIGWEKTRAGVVAHSDYPFGLRVTAKTAQEAKAELRGMFRQMVANWQIETARREAAANGGLPSALHKL